jgi:hypothetical protein
MSVDFEPVRLRRRDRRIDPIAVGLVVVLIALAVAVLKPWGDGSAGVAATPSPVGFDSPTPMPSRVAPAATLSGDLAPPTWANFAPVIVRRQAWGVRTIVLDAGTEVPDSASSPYEERWFSAGSDVGPSASLIADPGGAAIVALGVTFPPAETPLGVRVWLRHEGEFEWIDARPVDEVPGRGAYLFLRRDEAQPTSIRSWEPGHYRVDVLVGDGIRRIEVDVVGRSGVVPDPAPWARVLALNVDPVVSDMAALPVGLFAQADGATVLLASEAGPALDETGAWLDLDRRATDEATRSFVARTYQPRATWLGAVLPPSSEILSARLQRLAPFDIPSRTVGGTMTETGDTVSFVAFAPSGGGTWRPGVYALSVDWLDAGEGAHRSTWHAELRPGRVEVEPILLSATRAWARHAGSRGILMATPETWSFHEGFDGSSAIGCGKAGVRGRPTVIGFVGPEEAVLAPVTSTMLFPFADAGPLPVLTASGAVPGLSLAAPVLTAEFGGPASYGFRAGTAPEAPGYTVCIGLVPPAG